MASVQDVAHVQKYLDDIYPAASTLDGISVRIALSQSSTKEALNWLIAQRRAIEVPSDPVQYQSTKTVRAVSRGFEGSMDGHER